jgi:leader peptidase (prepilin peptidase)/N-methyltransferase
MTGQLKSDRLSTRLFVEPSDQIMLTNIAILPAILQLPHDPAMIVKGVFFVLLLTAAGYTDAKTREIPDEFCGLIFLLSLILPEPSQSLIGTFFVSVPLWILGTLIPGSVGGGDIKLLAACGAVLGPAGIVAGTIFSFAMFLIYMPIRFLPFRKREKKVAMAPWFGIGCFLAYLIKMNGG